MFGHFVMLCLGIAFELSVAWSSGVSLVFGIPSVVCENCSWPDAFVTLQQAGDQSILIGSAKGVGNVISHDGARTWKPTDIEYPCGQHCLRDPSGRLHGFGTGPMPRFHAANVTQSTFGFPESRYATVDTNGNVSVELRLIPETFELGFGVRCAAKSHWGGWPAQCPFWGASSGGSVRLLDGQTLLTVVVPWLGGDEGATEQNSGIYGFVSNDTCAWKQRSHIVTREMFPNSGEGASENSIARLSNGSLMTIFRVDAGDGQLWIQPPCPTSSTRYPSCLYSNYFRTVSVDEGWSWMAPQEINNAGAAFPRLLNVGSGLLLSGGRSVNRGRWDMSIWWNDDGLGNTWQEFSLSALHNQRIGERVSKLWTNATTGEHVSLAMAAAINTTEYTSAYTSLLALDNNTAVVIYGRRTWPASFAMRIAING